MARRLKLTTTVYTYTKLEKEEFFHGHRHQSHRSDLATSTSMESVFKTKILVYTDRVIHVTTPLFVFIIDIAYTDV